MNNRQAGRRNRGRNNGRPGGNNRNGGDNGNRIDNRARGNAPQLLEKYRNLARDAQLAGDRVNTEYYLQFADHYFRVIADNRQRQEEQQARYRRNDEPLEYELEGEQGFEDGLGQEGGEAADAGYAGDDQGYEARDRGDRRDRRERNDRGGDRSDRGDRSRRDQRPRRDEFQGEPVAAEAGDTVEPVAEEQPQERRRRGRPSRQEQTEGEAPGLDLAALPPAIARADNDGEAEVAAEAAPVRRRGRKPRTETEAAE